MCIEFSVFPLVRDLKLLFLLQLQEYIGGLVEIHGVVQPNNQILCHNYVIFSPENASDFGKQQFVKQWLILNSLLIRYYNIVNSYGKN